MFVIRKARMTSEILVNWGGHITVLVFASTALLVSYIDKKIKSKNDK